MNTQTTELLEKLAEKLGTTTEYLWGVLISQAHIAATTTLFQTILIIFFGVILWKAHCKLISPMKENSRLNYYNEYEAGAVAPMILGIFIFIILAVTAFFHIDDMVNGFFNPEYWALDKILKQL